MISRKQLMAALPIRSITDIMSSVFDGEETMAGRITSFEKAYAEYFDGGRFDPMKYLESQSKTDALTDILYWPPNSQGNINYPFAVPDKKIKDGLKKFSGPIGAQTSTYHQETIREHLCCVTARLSNTEIDGLDKQDILLTALLHDAGKKYTAGTNAKRQSDTDPHGQLCFYGHEKVSAYITARVLKDMGYSREKAEVLVTAIYNHLALKVAPYKMDLDMNSLAGKLQKALSDVDEGYRSLEEIDEDRGTIEQGKEIVIHLSEELIHK